MDDATLRRLEFPAILQQLAAHCSFPPSRELALNLKPSTNTQVVRRRLQEVGEAVKFLNEGLRLEGSLPDVRPALQRARKGGVLSGSDLIAVAEFAQTQAVWGRLVRPLDRFPALVEMTAPMVACDPLVNEIHRCISPDGAVRDQASGELTRLRQRSNELHRQIRQRLDSVVRHLARQGYLQEALVTQRHGRFVIPVKAEHRSQVPGLIHDRSSSGLTLFIEPAVVTELNNDLRQTNAAIEKEVERILKSLSGLVVDWLPKLEPALRAVTYFDFTFARARLALSMKAVAPEMAERPVLSFQGARHPLLGSNAVPIDISVGSDFDILIITGPNTGGKTVALKTAGLLAVMVQAGLHVPCGEAYCGIFQHIFADIGDEQSIEQSLSTFSSHLANLLTIIPKASAASLILLDELGAGTDPEEGAALALALLDYFRSTGAKVIVTTHYGQLKAYAYRHQRVKNASVEFDSATLRPTYRLLMGVPGRSNALEIAGRLGLPPAIVAQARAYLSTGTLEMEDALDELEQLRRQLEAERNQLRQIRAENQRLQMEWQQALKQLEQLRRRFTETERVTIKSRLNRIYQEAEELLAELRQARLQELGAAEVDRIGTRTRQRLQDLRRQLEDAIELDEVTDDQELIASPASRYNVVDAETSPVSSQSVKPKTFKIGDTVFVKTLRQVGRVLETPAGHDSGGEVLVQVGAIKVRVPAEYLEVTGDYAQGGETTSPQAETTSSASTVQLSRQKAAHIPTEIHLRGLTIDEALWRLDKYLDDAYIAGLETVKVIHGKGTGALRQAVHDVLRKDSRIASFSLGGPGEGGYGVTIVRFRTN